MRNRTIRSVILFILVGLMFLASGRHRSYFCVSPWTGDAPISDQLPMPVLSLDHVRMATPVVAR